MIKKVESELDRAYSQIKAMGEEIDRWQALSAKQLQEYGELATRVSVLEEDNDRLRGHIRELTEQRNTLQDMAEIAARFSPLGGER